MLSICLSLVVLANADVTITAYDAQTHQAIRGDAIVQSADGEHTVRLGETIKTSGEIVVGVLAEGYHPSISAFAPDGELRIAFYLEPKNPPVETTHQWIDARRSPGGSLVMGFLTDQDTGAPIAGALVTSGGQKTHSNENGFFWYVAPAGNGWDTVRIEHPRYATLTRTSIPVWPGGDWTMRIRLTPGSGSMIDREAHNLIEPKKESAAPNDDAGIQVASVGFPLNIRVGRNCPTSRTCTTVEVHPMENYVKRVLASEWYSCWGSLTNGMNSLRAGAVSVRSYGLWYVYNPLDANYDICDTTSCQVFGTSTSTNANNAVDQTPRYILLLSSGTVARSEYSAENNNSGCGDGYTGTGTSWPCIADPVCTGFSSFGHGRGLCQWGSARWAAGTRILTSSPCAAGTTHGHGTKTWQQILAHYYPQYTLVQAASATLNGVTSVPFNVKRGTRPRLDFSLTATEAFPLMLGASIRPSSGGSYVSDPPNDRKLTVPAGASVQPRLFTVPANQPTGLHDGLTALWFDRNNNGLINTGDIVLSSANYTALMNVRVNVAGDVDFDGCVDDIDLSRVLSAFGQSGVLPEDQNYDGIVDDLDLAIVLSNFGVGC
ncbi:MAG: hypothetical protein HUU60_06530 [Armatimonadetes bacterium]|nr:hypothetical protein [Armatimonadota bacterium]